MSSNRDISFLVLLFNAHINHYNRMECSHALMGLKAAGAAIRHEGILAGNTRVIREFSCILSPIPP